MKSDYLIPFLLLFIVLTVRSSAQMEPRLAVVNAKIITMDEKNPKADAMVIEGERIIYVGNSDQAQKICGPQCWILDLSGLAVVPGFNDSHTHTVEGGMRLLQPNLYGKSCEEIVKIIAEEVKKSKPGRYILGHDWDFGFCPNPDRRALDQVSKDNPVMLSQYGGHSLWVNSYLLDKLGISADSKDPAGGKIDRDQKGKPTGILRETAAEPAYVRSLFSIPMAQRRKGISKALELYRRAGITSVQDNSWDPRTIWALGEFKEQGKLTCRFTCWSLGERWYAPAMLRFANYYPGWVRRGPAKIYADGSFSTKTAWMTKPYPGEPDNFGIPRHTQAELNRHILNAAQTGQQVAVHAIGDRAVQSTLDAIELAEKQYPKAKKLRFRLEHIQMVRPEDFPRFQKLGVLASVQPFALGDPEKDLRLLGKERAKQAYPYRSLMTAGASISFGSDFPAELDFEPLLGIYYAVNRKSKTGKPGPLNPDERLTVQQALWAYTMGGAYAEFMEKEKGSLEPGKLADFAVLSKSPLEVNPEKIKDIEVRYTFVGGKQVWPEVK